MECKNKLDKFSVLSVSLIILVMFLVAYASAEDVATPSVDPNKAPKILDERYIMDRVTNNDPAEWNLLQSARALAGKPAQEKYVVWKYAPSGNFYLCPLNFKVAKAKDREMEGKPELCYDSVSASEKSKWATSVSATDKATGYKVVFTHKNYETGLTTDLFLNGKLIDKFELSDWSDDAVSKCVEDGDKVICIYVYGTEELDRAIDIDDISLLIYYKASAAPVTPPVQPAEQCKTIAQCFAQIDLGLVNSFFKNVDLTGVTGEVRPSASAAAAQPAPAATPSAAPTTAPSTPPATTPAPTEPATTPTSTNVPPAAATEPAATNYYVLYKGATLSKTFAILEPDAQNEIWWSDPPIEKIDLKPGQSLIILGKENDEEELFTDNVFMFTKLEVMGNYLVQAYAGNYDGKEFFWEKFDNPVKNNETLFADTYTYGLIQSESEQEGTGIEFHDYKATDPGVMGYEVIKDRFTRWKNANKPGAAATEQPVAPITQPVEVIAPEPAAATTNSLTAGILGAEGTNAEPPSATAPAISALASLDTKYVAAKITETRQKEALPPIRENSKLDKTALEIAQYRKAHPTERIFMDTIINGVPVKELVLREFRFLGISWFQTIEDNFTVSIYAISNVPELDEKLVRNEYLKQSKYNLFGSAAILSEDESTAYVTVIIAED